jgi:hypothetical protein
MPQAGKYFNLSVNDQVAVEDAIQQAFGMSAPQLDKALRAYLNSGRYKYYPIPSPAAIASSGYTPKPFSPLETKSALAACTCTLLIIGKRQSPSLRRYSRHSRRMPLRETLAEISDP